MNTSRAGTTVSSSSVYRAARSRTVGRRVKCGAYTSASIPRSLARATTSSSSTFTWASTRVCGRVTVARSSRPRKDVSFDDDGAATAERTARRSLSPPSQYVPVAAATHSAEVGNR
ncbi:hypothetical protein [Halorubrum californiense]|nr:hypothetical protein [Halorubrum californiense]